MTKSILSDFSLKLVISSGIAIAGLRFFLAFFFGQSAPTWYVITSYICELLAFLGAGCLCLRNYFHPKIISDRMIWLCLAIGTLSFFIGDLIFLYWEVILERSPNITLADLFFVNFYVFLIGGMILAVMFRKVRLMPWQWGTIILVAAIAIGLGWWTSSPSDTVEVEISTAITEQVVEKAPGWVIATEQLLEPIVSPLNLFYVAGDIFILVLAATIVITFWGGKFSQTWMAIGCAIFVHYLADLRYAYIVTHDSYTTGGIIECFWTVSGVLFAIGAALEYNLSNRSRKRLR
ncbi:hypothetical protein Sta7437_3967 [Stanieria cyanosphaera PCC 7437]|uniref:Uncharacterized protein n=1 Tax=Stanieria cyanosphaera (strain ATCC 29371 / PCC 7437) TaxID=111780 RepID=K9XZH9_STAC7|nr:hypothetical protein [Stanieria cyanosphaera]AFZ37449.1 hypothetical protein Sta7437_3967 [Stanieria cyanosphaera PCC 7437]